MMKPDSIPYHHRQPYEQVFDMLYWARPVEESLFGQIPPDQGAKGLPQNIGQILNKEAIQVVDARQRVEWLTQLGEQINPVLPLRPYGRPGTLLIHDTESKQPLRLGSFKRSTDLRPAAWEPEDTDVMNAATASEDELNRTVEDSPVTRLFRANEKPRTSEARGWQYANLQLRRLGVRTQIVDDERGFVYSRLTQISYVGQVGTQAALFSPRTAMVQTKRGTGNFIKPMANKQPMVLGLTLLGEDRHGLPKLTRLRELGICGYEEMDKLGPILRALGWG